MSALIRPRGTLPARVYWFRRSLLLVLAFALVFGIGRLLGGGGSDEPPAAATPAASTSNTGAPAATQPLIGPTPFTPAPATGQAAKPRGDGTTVQPATQPTAPLAQPTGECEPQSITVTPALITARAGQDVKIPLDFTGTQPACTFRVSADSIALKVALDGARVWTTQQCPTGVREQEVVVRAAHPARVLVTWSGRYSDEECSTLTRWAMPDTYQLDAAVIGSEPSTSTFRLETPPRPVVTRTATPKPQPKAPKPAGR